MEFLYVLIGLGVLTLISFLLSVRRTWKRRTDLPFRLEPVLFSDKEHAFLSVLEQSLAPDYRVFGKVRLSDVLSFQGRVDRQTRERALGRIGDRKLDFVICTSGGLSIAGAVELVGSGRKGDKMLAKICDTVALPLIRLQAADSYDAHSIEDQVRTLINAPRIDVKPKSEDGKVEKDENMVLSGLSASIRDDDLEIDWRARRDSNSRPSGSKPDSNRSVSL